MESSAAAGGLIVFTGIIFLLLAIVGGIAFYMLPFIISCCNKHPQRGAIFLVNFLLGWTFVGWIVTLVWSFTKNEPTNIYLQNSEKNLSSVDELSKLAELKEKGILSEEEFNTKKKQILNSNKF